MSQCQQCSSELAADAPRGMCPACLLSTGLGFALVTDSEGEKPDLGDRYRLGKLLGEGGFGSVYQAQQLQPIQRQVAVKILKPGMAAGQVLARFEAERQALALMDHPNIARILDAGEAEDGRPYFVMELVDGEPITASATARKLSVTEKLTLFQKVTDALAHAHQKGIIHRDLKPSNILVSAKSGEPVLIDFGVAKALAEPLTDRPMYTKVHQAIGTPAYMSPEQCGGRAGEIDTRSDVYASGAVLYELLGGRPPFVLDEAMSYPEVMDAIRNREAIPPSMIDASLPRELDWICAKAMAKEPERRYGGAGEFGRDVGRFLRDETLAAGPPSRVYALRKLVARNRGLFAMGAAAVLALVAGIVTSLTFYFESEETNDALQHSYVQRSINNGNNAARGARAGDAVAHYCDALRTDPDNELATSQLLGLLLHHRWVRPMAAPVALPDDAEAIEMAVGGRRAWLLSERGDVIAVSLEGAEVLERVEGAQSLVAHGDGYTVIGQKTVGEVAMDSMITAWDLVTDPEAPAVLVGCEDGGVFAIDLNSSERSAAFPIDQKVVAIAAGELLSAPFSMASENVVYAGSWEDKKPRKLWMPEGQVRELEMLRPGQLVAAAAGDTAGVFSVDGDRKIESLGPLGGVTGGFDFISSKRLLLTGCGDGRPRLWDLDFGSGQGSFRLSATQHREAVSAAHFLPDGDSAISVGVGGVARVWDINTGRGERLRAGGRIDGFEVGSDRRTAVSYDRDARTATLWALDRSPALSPRIDWLEGAEILLEHGASSVEIDKTIITNAAGEIGATAVSPSGERIATCVDGRTLQLWRASDAAELCPRFVVESDVTAMAFRGENVLQLGYGSGSVREVALPPAGAELDDAFLDFVEAFVCRQSLADGSLKTVSALPLNELDLKPIRLPVGRQFASWLVADGENRGLWPGASLSLESYGNAIIALGLEGRREAARLGISGAVELLKARPPGRRKPKAPF